VTRRVGWVVALAALASALITPVALADAPSNDNMANATTIAALAFDADADLTEATVEVDEPDCGGWFTPGQQSSTMAAPREENLIPLSLKTSHGERTMTNTVWYAFEPTEDVRISADTFGSADDQDTMLAAYDHTQSGLTMVGCNDDTNTLQSRIAFDATAGHRYLIQLGAYYGGATSAHLHVDVAPPPGVISGTVTDDDSGAPIADVCVGTSGEFEWRWVGTDAYGTYSGEAEPGETRVVFFDCEIAYEDENYYPAEYYDNVTYWEEATVLVVESGLEIAGIDAGLSLEPIPWRSSDLAVTGLEIEHVMPRVDGLVAPVGPGTNRNVTVEVANVGDGTGFGYVNVQICPVTTNGACTYLEPRHVRLDSAEVVAMTFEWRGLGTVGDVDVQAYVDSCDYDFDDNNSMTRRDYVMVGGIGAGVGVPRGSASYVDCGYGISVWSP